MRAIVKFFGIVLVLCLSQLSNAQTEKTLKCYECNSNSTQPCKEATCVTPANFEKPQCLTQTMTSLDGKTTVTLKGCDVIGGKCSPRYMKEPHNDKCDFCDTPLCNAGNIRADFPKYFLVLLLGVAVFL